jgi:hypothetical protein
MFGPFSTQTGQPVKLVSSDLRMETAFVNTDLSERTIAG